MRKPGEFQNAISCFSLQREYVFSAKGAGSCKPGATPQGKVCPKASAESANQIIAEEDAEVNRAVSAGKFLTKTWGVAPG